jgi:hypothetical protein
MEKPRTRKSPLFLGTRIDDLGPVPPASSSTYRYSGPTNALWQAWLFWEVFGLIAGLTIESRLRALPPRHPLSHLEISLLIIGAFTITVLCIANDWLKITADANGLTVRQGLGRKAFSVPYESIAKATPFIDREIQRWDRCYLRVTSKSQRVLDLYLPRRARAALYGFLQDRIAT